MQAFNCTLLSGRLRQVVIQATTREGGSYLTPYDLCTKIGRLEKYFLQEPPSPRSSILIYGPEKSNFEMYEDIPDKLPLEISGADVEVVERCIDGSGGPGGADTKVLRYWCNRSSSWSEHLQEEIP